MKDVTKQQTPKGVDVTLNFFNAKIARNSMYSNILKMSGKT